jgi:DNA-binding ferritin-like protein
LCASIIGLSQPCLEQRSRGRNSAPRETVDLITTRIYATVGTMRFIIHDEADSEDPSTADLLHQSIDSFEKAAWMLKSENRKI